MDGSRVITYEDRYIGWLLVKSDEMEWSKFKFPFMDIAVFWPIDYQAKHNKAILLYNTFLVLNHR